MSRKLDGLALFSAPLHLEGQQLDEILTVQVDIRIDTHAEEQKMGFILTSQ